MKKITLILLITLLQVTTSNAAVQIVDPSNRRMYVDEGFECPYKLAISDQEGRPFTAAELVDITRIVVYFGDDEFVDSNTCPDCFDWDTYAADKLLEVDFGSRGFTDGSDTATMFIWDSDHSGLRVGTFSMTADGTLGTASESAESGTLASLINLTTTNFDGNLSSADDTVQKAMETLDDMTVAGGGSTDPDDLDGDTVDDDLIDTAILKTATPADGTTDSVPTADQTYDWVIGLGYSVFTWDFDGDDILDDSIDDDALDFGSDPDQINTTDLPEGTNLYYTDLRAQGAVVLDARPNQTDAPSTYPLGTYVTNTESDAPYLWDQDGAVLFGVKAAEANGRHIQYMIDMVSGTYQVRSKNVAVDEFTAWSDLGILDDTAGNGDTKYTWSADKIFDLLAAKQDVLASTPLYPTDIGTSVLAPDGDGSQLTGISATPEDFAFGTAWNGDGDATSKNSLHDYFILFDSDADGVIDGAIIDNTTAPASSGDTSITAAQVKSGVLTDQNLTGAADFNLPDVDDDFTAYIRIVDGTYTISVCPPTGEFMMVDIAGALTQLDANDEADLTSVEGDKFIITRRYSATAVGYIYDIEAARGGITDGGVGD